MARGPVILLVTLLALAGAPTAAAQAPSLSGETLTSDTSLSSAADCGPSNTGTGSYTVAGPAIGPFPGSFEETGTVTIENGQVTAFEATFTIQSGLSEIQGTKTLQTSIRALCLEDPTASLADFAEFEVQASYEATITTPMGTFTDHGVARAGGQLQVTSGGLSSAAAQESFISEAVPPTPTAGHTTGGGYVGDVVDEWISFGFAAKSDGTNVKAQCSVTDHATGVHVRCLNATLLVQTGTHATFIGDALVDGERETYRIDVHDLGEPGAGSDRFVVVTETFSAAGVLAGGNIQIRG
jgi:hypothetical protein